MNQSREFIIDEVKRKAVLNGGQPLGQRTFYKETQLTCHALHCAGFATYGDALEAAGFERNRLKQAFTDDQLFEPLARLTRQLRRFPGNNHRRAAHYQDTALPGNDAYLRRAKQGSLLTALFEWCQQKPSFHDVCEVLEPEVTRERQGGGLGTRARRVVNGYVYLMRYGARRKEFKIGQSENVSRREAQLNMMSPDDVRIVHVIETDDPKGIEKYWHERFAARRIGNKEVFRLTREDIAAFKTRRYQ